MEFIPMKLESIVLPLVGWYKKEKRDLPWREDKDPYKIWISEIMLQQTRIEAVIPYYHRFLACLPSVQALSLCEDETLLKLWEGLGYYSRAKNLKKAALQIMENHGGKMPQTPKELSALSGIGDYTAGAIASIAFGQPAPAVDGNVLRVVARLLRDSRDMAAPKAKKEISAMLLPVYPKGEAAGEFTEALMELGERICLPKGAPKCEECPLNHLCESFKAGDMLDFPVLSPKKGRRKEEKTVFLLSCGNRFALRKRPPKGLLAGLWEYPNEEGVLTPDEVLKKAAEWGAQPQSIAFFGEKVHVFSHVEWHMKIWQINCAAAPPAFLWKTEKEREEALALPSAFWFKEEK